MTLVQRIATTADLKTGFALWMAFHMMRVEALDLFRESERRMWLGDEWTDAGDRALNNSVLFRDS